jgi:thiamine-monophosphate kinase
VRESELLTHIYGRSADLPKRFPQVLAGPGHDCAVVAVGGEQVLLKVDQVVGGRHFRETGTPVDLIARKAVARSVSDIAAAGGTPLAAMAAATLPDGYTHADALFDAMARWAAHFGCPLVGGDIATGPGPLVLSVSILGRPHAARGPVLRSGAVAGDGAYVTGTLGGSLDAATGLGRHLTFEPRLREAKFLCDTLGFRLHAMMDVSDGLGRDAGRLARASSASITLEEAALPMTSGVSDWRRAMGDGEDFELLFAASGPVPSVCPDTGTVISRVGTVDAGPPRAVLVARDGARIDVSTIGWEHGQA